MTLRSLAYLIKTPHNQAPCNWIALLVFDPFVDEERSYGYSVLTFVDPRLEHFFRDYSLTYCTVIKLIVLLIGRHFHRG